MKSHAFAVRFRSKEALSTDGTTITPDDALCWLLEEPEGWVPATATRVHVDRDELPKDLKTFDTEAQAEAFMRGWGGHPWYYVPKSWEVVRVTAHMKSVFSHYSLAD